MNAFLSYKFEALKILKARPYHLVGLIGLLGLLGLLSEWLPQDASQPA
ncbi:hypothetical protein ACFW0H_17965 [Pseudomonas sp. CR3202]